MGVRYNQLFDLQNKFLTEHNGLCGKSCHFISPHMFTAVADILAHLLWMQISHLLLYYVFSVVLPTFLECSFFLFKHHHNSSKQYIFSDNTGTCIWNPLILPLSHFIWKDNLTQASYVRSSLKSFPGINMIMHCGTKKQITI